MSLEFFLGGKKFEMSVRQMAKSSGMRDVKLKVTLFDDRGQELLSEEYVGEMTKLRDICSYCKKRIFGEGENKLKPEVNNFLLYHFPQKVSIRFSTLCPNCQMEQDEIILFPGDSFGNFFD